MIIFDFSNYVRLIEEKEISRIGRLRQERKPPRVGLINLRGKVNETAFQYLLYIDLFFFH